MKAKFFERRPSGAIVDLSGPSPEDSEAEGARLYETPLEPWETQEMRDTHKRFKEEEAKLGIEMSRLRERVEAAKASQRMINEIPSLFDSGSLSRFDADLDVLNRLGIVTIKIDGKEFPIARLREMLQGVWAVVTSMQEEVTKGTRITRPTEEEVGDKLASLNLPDGKISSTSRRSFREAVIAGVIEQVYG